MSARHLGSTSGRSLKTKATYGYQHLSLLNCSLTLNSLSFIPPPPSLLPLLTLSSHSLRVSQVRSGFQDASRNSQSAPFISVKYALLRPLSNFPAITCEAIERELTRGQQANAKRLGKFLRPSWTPDKHLDLIRSFLPKF